MRTVTMSKTGRITLPAEARKALGLNGETELEVEVDHAKDEVILRPAVVLRREDAWAYTPRHRKLLAKARADIRAGRIYKMTEEQLMELAERADARDS